ncbi:MAG: hypothetical protein DHS20C05_20000 [Hyphococcus sp.]|nr:MAG: hypothetical protein DHS20C05_20000 [Marinicaulis sp.]
MTGLKAKVRDELLAFDGRAISILSQAIARHHDEPEFLDVIISLSADPEDYLADGATWIIKDHLDKGGVLTASQTNKFVSQAIKTESWAANLHVCQSVQHLSVSEKAAKELAPWLGILLEHKRPFLRAWSMDALSAIAKAHPEYEKKAKAAIKAGLEDSAASVRARAKNLS